MHNALMPAPQEWAQIKEQAGILVKTGFLPPSVRTPEQAIAIMLMGRELGLAPMQAFKSISIINGKPALGAELMLGKIYERYPNADIRIVKNEKDGAEIHASRPGKDHLQKFSFTIQEAQEAGLTKKDSWRNYPKAMCLWRAVSAMARAVFPECLMGGPSHTPEELGADVDEDGEIYEVEYQAAPELEAPRQEEQEAAKPEPKAEKKVRLFDKSQTAHRAWLSGALAKENFPASIYKQVEQALHGKPLDDARATAEAILAKAQGETLSAIGD